MPAERFAVGQRVAGATIPLRNMQGTIQEVVGGGRQLRYRVLFTDGRILDCTSRSLSRMHPPVEPAAIPVTGGENDSHAHSDFGDSSGSDSSDSSSSSDSSDSSSSSDSSGGDEGNAGNDDDAAWGDFDERLRPHGQVWVDSGDIAVDPANNRVHVQATQLNWHGMDVGGQNEVIDSYRFFALLFPMRFLNATVVPLTNERRSLAATSTGEVLKFLGVTLVMGLDPCRGGTSAYWAQERENTTIAGRDFLGRFDMSRDRFKQLRSCLRFNPEINAAQAEVDPWHPIRLR